MAEQGTETTIPDACLDAEGKPDIDLVVPWFWRYVRHLQAERDEAQAATKLATATLGARINGLEARLKEDSS